MTHGIFQSPTPVNEPVLGYAPGSPERAALEAEVARQATATVEVPLIIGGEEIRTGNTAEMVCPHEHQHVLGTFHKARPEDVQRAIDAATAARADWEVLPWQDRATVFLYEEATHELVSTIATGSQELRVSADRGIVGESARTRHVINVPDCYSDSRFNRAVDKSTGYRTRCLMTVPLIGHDDSLQGVLQVLNKHDGSTAELQHSPIANVGDKQ